MFRARSGKSATKAKCAVSISSFDSHKSRLANLQRNQFAVFCADRLVVRGDLAVSPVARKVIGADEQQRFVVGSTQFNGGIFGGDSQNGGGSLRAIDSDQTAFKEFGGTTVFWHGGWWRILFGG